MFSPERAKTARQRSAFAAWTGRYRLGAQYIQRWSRVGIHPERRISIDIYSERSIFIRGLDGTRYIWRWGWMLSVRHTDGSKSARIQWRGGCPAFATWTGRNSLGYIA